MPGDLITMCNGITEAARVLKVPKRHGSAMAVTKLKNSMNQCRTLK
jgi:hypothetical protein